MRKPKPSPTETTDDASAVAAPSLPVIATQSLQRPSAGRVMVNALGGIGRAGAPRHVRPTDFPPREAVPQQPQRWVDGRWSMVDGWAPSAPFDGLSCAQRRATQASRVVL